MSGGLAIRDLSVAIQGRPVLRGVSLDVAPGQVLALVGESGSGKSMTALAAMGLLPPGAVATGAVSLDGVPLLNRPDAELARVRGRDIGMVFQEPMTALNPVRTIGDQVAETVRQHAAVSRAAAMERARDTLARVGLDPAAIPPDRYPHELSGGQRQRVAIAIAVACKPRIILADEPTTALDVVTQAQVLDLLTRLAREDGAGLLLITHDLALVAGMADRIAVMKDGAVVERGDAPELLRAPQHPYTQGLLRDAGHLPSRAPRPAEPAEPLLEVRGLVRAYAGPRRSLFRKAPPIRAVDGVDLTIRRGESVGLVGPSGCGKSTLLRTVLALEAPDRGEVRLLSRSLTAARGAELRDLRRRIQVVFQDPYGSFDPRWTVERLVAEPLHLLPDPPRGAARRRRVEAMLDSVGLSPADADRYPHQFSGGQRQRIAIARALIVEPAVVALDEAVSALDVTIRARILDLLADLSDRLGLSYLFVSHDLAVVRAITDRVLVMQAGRIVEEGPTEQVFQDPRHPLTRTLVAAAPSLDRALAGRVGPVSSTVP